MYVWGEPVYFLIEIFEDLGRFAPPVFNSPSFCSLKIHSTNGGECVKLPVSLMK